MAVRIRKLARELNRTPTDLIGVLHALGLSRYRSADDMLPATAEERLRKGVRSGVHPVPVDIVHSDDPELDEPAPQADLMARLVPGVVPVGERAEDRMRRLSAPGAFSPPSPGQPPPRPRVVPSPEPRATLVGRSVDRVADAPPEGQVHAPMVADGERRALQAERAAIDSLRRGLESERAVLAAERAELDEDRRRYDAQVHALDGEREALADLARAMETERSALDAERAAVAGQVERMKSRGGVLLQDLLEERGLRGSDEFERTIVALAQGRLLREALWSIRVDSPEVLRKVVSERLLLVDGPPSEAVARVAATVVVAPERSEVPGATALGRLVTALGEAVLLNGMRRVTLVGGRPLWHRLIRESIDPRVELRSVAAKARDASQASSDVDRTDLVILWGVDLVPAARAVYQGSRAVIVEVQESGLTELLQTVVARLHE